MMSVVAESIFGECMVRTVAISYAGCPSGTPVYHTKTFRGYKDLALKVSSNLEQAMSNHAAAVAKCLQKAKQ